MANAIAKLIESLVLGLMSETLSHTKHKIWNKIRLYRFNKSLSSWIRQFINAHDGTVLTTDDFESYLTYHKPLDRILDAIIGDNSVNTEELLLSELVSRFKSVRHKNNNMTCHDEMILKDLFCGIYQRINLFYRKQLSDSEKYMISQVKKAKGEIVALQEKSDAELKQEVLKIRELLQEGQQIKYEDILWIYEEVGKLLIEGKAEAVKLLLPLLNKNTPDLVYAVPYLLGLMSDYNVKSKNFAEIQECIKDDSICSDIVRKTIYYSLITDNRQALQQVSKRNSDLRSIAENLMLCNYSLFYKEVEQDRDGVKTIHIEVLNNYPNERWLVLRICAMALLSKPVKNAADAIVELLGNDQSITEKILYFERKSVEIQSTNYDNAEPADKLFSEMINVCAKVERLPVDIQVKYYIAMLRTSVLISLEKGKEAVCCVPQELQNNKEIEMLSMHVRIMADEVDVEKIVSICVKNDQYWLFNNYLIRFEKEPSRMREIIETYKFIISKDVSVFLMYVQIISMDEGKEKGRTLLESYQESFSGYLEYWVEKTRLCPPEKARNILEFIYGNKKLISCSPQSRIVFIRMLCDFEHYEEALNEIEHESIYGTLTEELVYIKAIILLRTKKEIEAWDSFCALFAAGRHNAEILFYLLVLANRNKRDLDDSILQAALISDNSKVLLCLSNYYELHQNWDSAEITLLRSMLLSNGNLDEVFGNYLRVHSIISNRKEPTLEVSDVDSAVHMESLDGSKKKIICIHKFKVLPQDPYKWENAYHIYKDTAIQKGIYRKRTGDIIVIEGESFKIVEILTFDCYLFRLSMQKTVDAGKAKYIYLTTGDNGKIDLEELTKELVQNIDESTSEPQWLNQYKDMSATPVTIFFAEKFVRVNYLHLTLALLRDNEIMMRELAPKCLPENTQYILSFTSIIALHEIGFDPDECAVDLAISTSSLNEIDIKVEELISENSRDHVASMGIQDGQLFFTESSEETKQAIMQSAVSIKTFAHKFKTIENDKDLQLHDDPQFDSKEFFGICDYDTIATAKEHNRVIVAFEAIIAAFSGFSGIEADTISIADFLSMVCNNPIRLVSYVQRLFELRFMFPFTATLVNKLIEGYGDLPEQKQKELIMNWESALNIPFCDKKYRTIIAEHARSVFVEAYESIDISNPIWKIFVKYTLRYLGIKMQLHLSPSGEWGIDIVSSDED